MATIKQLSEADIVKNGDQFPFFSEAQGDTRKVTFAALKGSVATDFVSTAKLAAQTGATLVGCNGGTNVQQELNALDSGKASLAALAASSGSSLIGFLQSGTGATARTVQSKLRELSISIEDFYSGTLPYVNPYTSTTYTSRQAAPDISDALDAALKEAASMVAGGARSTEVRIPPGLYTISRPIVRPSNVFIAGAGCDIGPGATHIRRTGDFGSSFVGNPGVFVPGTFVSGGGYRNFRLYVDHGGDAMWGYFNPAAGSFINKTTTGAHFEESFPKDVVYDNLSLWGMPYVFSILGGADCKFRNLDVHGIWDPLSVARQEGIEAFRFDGDLTNGIPTSHDFYNITISGEKVAGSVTYPGGFTKSTVVNQGFKRGFVIKCAEEWRVVGLYIQGMAESDLVFRGKANAIIQGIKFSSCGFDPCGVGVNDAAIKFEDEGAGSAIPTALSFAGCQILFQGNGYVGISDKSTTAGKASVCGLTWDGEMSTFVGVAVHLERGTHVSIGGSVRAFNNDNFYTGDQACGIYFGSEAKSWAVSATLGGSSFGATTGHYCIDGVRSANSAGSGGNVSAASNGGLSGSLYVANGKIMDRLLDDGSVQIVGSNNFTYDIKTGGKRLIVNSALTADQTITLPSTGVPTGWTLYIQRTISASGAFEIIAGPLRLTATNTYGVITYYDGVGWITMEKGVIA